MIRHIISIQSGYTIKTLTTFNSSANELKTTSMTTMFPYLHDTLTCTAILLTNLAEPQWVQINCETQYTISDVLCLTESHDEVSVYNFINSDLYDKNCVIQSKVCYLFLWFHTIDQISHFLKVDTVFKGHIKTFQFLFMAVEVIFPPILHPNKSYYFTYKRYGNYYQYQEKALSKYSMPTLLMISQRQSKDLVKSDNIFKCEINVYISHTYICDNNFDCPDGSKLDEDGCECNHTDVYSSKCKYIRLDDNENKHCSSFYYKTIEGACKMYSLGYQFERLLLDKPKTPFHCQNSKFISSSLVNDLVSDCGPNGEDEYLLRYALTDNSKDYCFQKHQFPCIDGHPLCYNISEICSYKLNGQHGIVPCRTGNHLQNCTEFECNMMFKCPGYYCIPWAYVCDGK